VAVDPADVLSPGRARDRLERAAAGRRARTLTSRRAGKYSRHRLARPGESDLALDATLRAAALRGGSQAATRATTPAATPAATPATTPATTPAATPAGSHAIAVERADLRRKVREHRSPLAVCFVVDNSYSVQADGLVAAVKGLVFRVLEDATRRGDRVALVAFSGGRPEATVALRLTTSLPLAAQRLREMPLSGRTPLADALRRARLLLRQELTHHPNAVPVVVAVTDGLPTTPLRPGGGAVRDALDEAIRLRRGGVRLVVADASRPGGRSGCGVDLAAAGGGVHLPLAGLVPESFARLLEELS
jgi:magnesium chelatase subunit D